MGNENFRGPNANIIRFDVSKVDGKFIKVPVYEERAYTAPAEIYVEDAYAEDLDYADVQPEANERRRFKGKTIAKAAIALSLAMGAVYAGDVAATFIQKAGKVITPSEAYDDLTELPGLVEPAMDAVRTITAFNGGK